MGQMQSKSERRQALRYNLKISIRTDDCLLANEALSNVSEGGACIETPAEHKPGEFILVNFFFKGESLCLPASIRWKKNAVADSYTYGVEFFGSGSSFFIGQRRLFQQNLARAVKEQNAQPLPQS
jgi:hypothetical protein